MALNGRYLDALALLVREQGKLVSKDRFLDEVWAGVPVTDEALTQCVRTLRRRWATTRPGHASSPPCPSTATASWPQWNGSRTRPSRRARSPLSRPRSPPPPSFWSWVLPIAAAGTLGGGAAGVIGGLVYGLIGAVAEGTGVLSALLVLAGVTLLLGLAGGAGMAFGVALTGRRSPCSGAWILGPLSLAGGAAGGLLVGAVVKLFGLDAFFTLLLGKSPGDITGALEGALLGAAVEVRRRPGRAGPSRRGVAIAGLAGGCAGAMIPVLGGRLLGGSLDLLVRHFPRARLRLDRIGRLFGEPGFGPQPGRHRRPGRRAVLRLRGGGDDLGAAEGWCGSVGLTPLSRHSRPCGGNPWFSRR